MEIKFLKKMLYYLGYIFECIKNVFSFLNFLHIYLFFRTIYLFDCGNQVFQGGQYVNISNDYHMFIIQILFIRYNYYFRTNLINNILICCLVTKVISYVSSPGDALS